MASRPVPDHVPPELIHNIGLIESPEFLAAPHDYMAALHQRCPPIFWSTGSQSAGWNLIKHEDAFFMLRSAEYFTNKGGTPFPRDPKIRSACCRRSRSAPSTASSATFSIRCSRRKASAARTDDPQARQ